MERYRRPAGSRRLAPLSDPQHEIRLLYLRDGSFEDQIACGIDSYPLASAPPFRAISYTWGPTHDGKCIELDGEQWRVRENCYYALQQARHFHPRSWVWIDSVCIDQKNTIEKSAQVAIMGEIFARAEGVLACIGPADESSEHIRQALVIADQIAQDLQGDKKFRDYWSAFRQLVSDEDAAVGLVSHWNAFCGRAYFHRLWVVQELYEGKKKCLSILCGLSLLNWNRLVHLQKALYSRTFNTGGKGGRYIRFSFALDYLDGLLKMRTSYADFSLAHFMNLVKRLDCEDPRDRVYGTLRLVDWDRVGIPRPNPDYTISKFDLGLQIMVHYSNGDFSDIHRLASALRLENDYLGIEPRKGGDCEDSHQTEVMEQYNISIYGAVRIGQDADGRLTAPLVQKRSRSDNACEIDQLASMIPVWEKTSPHQIFANGQLTALAGPDVQPGDIILDTEYFVLILRKQDDVNFHVTGKAVLLDRYESRQRYDWGCDCWATEGQPESFERIKVSFAASARDALTYASYCIRRHDLQSRTQRLAMDFPRLGSLVRAVTTSKWEPHQYIRPVKATCPEHDGTACLKSSRSGLEFCIASGCGLRVDVVKPDPGEREMATDCSSAKG